MASGGAPALRPRSWLWSPDCFCRGGRADPRDSALRRSGTVSGRARVRAFSPAHLAGAARRVEPGAPPPGPGRCPSGDEYLDGQVPPGPLRMRTVILAPAPRTPRTLCRRVLRARVERRRALRLTGVGLGALSGLAARTPRRTIASSPPWICCASGCRAYCYSHEVCVVVRRCGSLSPQSTCCVPRVQNMPPQEVK